MFKKAKVVMLPTNQKAHFGDIILSPFTKQLLIFQHQNCTKVAQHLYIISDEEIKEGDWYYNTVRKEITKCENKIEEESNKLFPQYAKKIIATNNTSLFNGEILVEHIIKEGPNAGLIAQYPQPSQQFIEKWIEEYNKGNVITDVLVEYNYELSCDEDEQGNLIPELYLKVNHKDNTITIKKVKDNYSREEVNELFEKYDFEIKRFGILDEYKHNYLEIWKKENL